MATLTDQDLPDTSYPFAGDDNLTLKLGQLMRIALVLLLRNIWVILAIIAAFVLGAIAYTVLQTPRYTATTTMEVATSSDTVLGDNFDAQSEVPDAGDVDRFLNTQISILESEAIAERVARSMELYSSPRFFAAMQADEIEQLSEAEKQRRVNELLMENSTVSLPATSRMMSLSFESTDPNMSAEIANAFSKEFIQANLQRRFDSSSYAREFVQEQLEQARAQLEDSERELNAYARSAQLIRTRDTTDPDSTNSSVTAASLMQMNNAANVAQSTRVAAQAKWDAERAQPLISSPAALESPTVQRLTQRAADLESQIEVARSRYLPDHPTVAQLESDLATVQQEQQAAALAARNAVRTEYEAALAAENRLKAQVSSLQTETLAEQDRSVRYNTLAREADTNREIYEGLLQRFRELNAAAGITSSNISIIDVATAPKDPSSPNLLLNLLVAIVLGGLTACGIVILRGQLDDRIRVPDEVETKVGLSLLGVIPKADGPIEEELENSFSQISESFGAFRTSLLYSTPQGLPKTLVVTSARPSEGKSTTSLGTAQTVAKIGKRVVLVDADLRRPTVHRLLDLENKHGLSSVLVGEASLEDSIVESPDKGIWALPSGPIPPNPAELLSSPRMVELLDELTQKFDFVVIDTAPVLGLADTPTLAAFAGGVVFVVEANSGMRGQVKASVRRLRATGSRLVGAVLTKYDPAKADNLYSYYNSYSYYGYKSEEA